MKLDGHPAARSLTLAALILASGCDAGGNSAAVPQVQDAASAETGAEAATDAASDAVEAKDAALQGDTTADVADAASADWHLTVYFTAVESFFSGAPVEVTGCLNVDCSASGDPDNVIGSYPSEFVDTVQAEGTGQISSGAHAGSFLNWSAEQPGSGYWLDTAARDAQGKALVAYVSAAAHPSYAYGLTFSVLGCGVDSTTAEPMDAQACADLKGGAWVISDRFESDSEVKHLDLYIGLQDRADMNTNPHFVDQVGAVTTLQ